MEGGAGAVATADGAEAINDPAFMSSVLGSLPGVDPNDPTVQEALAGLEKEEKEEKKEEEK